MVRPVVLTCLVLLAVAASAQDADFENDVIPREKTQAQDLKEKWYKHKKFMLSPNVQAGAPEVTTSKPDSKPENATPKPTGSRQPDFFSRLVDDIIQIPIAALRAVNALLNNISARTRNAAAVNATSTLKSKN